MRVVKRPLYLLAPITAVILAMAFSAFQTLNPASTATPLPTATLTSFNAETVVTPAVVPDLALHPIEHNADWTPNFQSFDGFEMALVPVGCFLMGSETGENNEAPVNQQCFDQPFWIDRYEVTNQQYGSEGYTNGAKQPRDSVTWFESSEFCDQRGARLPTEREWEYAARGPDNRVYPWGDKFVVNNVVYLGNSKKRSADVGTRHKGDSWVGASDLSGNLWEWVSTIYKPYPYESEDGREALNKEADVQRGLRGGSWNGYITFLRSTYRFWNIPTIQANFIGFRCVLPYE